MTESEYDELYQGERKRAIRNAVKLLGGGYQEDAEDCVQDTFAYMWEHRERITDPKEYLYSKLKYVCQSLLELSQPYELCGTTEQTLKRAGIR